MIILDGIQAYNLVWLRLAPNYTVHEFSKDIHVVQFGWQTVFVIVISSYLFFVLS